MTTIGQPDLLRGLTPKEVDSTLALGHSISVASGAQLFALGDPADCLYVIELGLIRLTLPMQVRGKEQDILVEERSAGQTIGWSALAPPYRFTLKATALVETDVLVLSRQALLNHFEVNPRTGLTVALNLSAVIGQRLQLFQAMWLREMQHLVEYRCA